jgi:hypothetical protein
LSATVAATNQYMGWKFNARNSHYQ